MPRSVRLEYPDAVYHVMARGNRREEIFLSHEGREEFLKTLGEVCERTGWQVLAWVLMSNHYHLAIATPEANLVAGMTWLQTTYTRRFNVRNSQWGRLFGDRYKAIPVQSEERAETRGVVDRPGDYLRTLIDYIHLNPVRAGMISPDREESILDYPWSSVAKGYALSASKRPCWLDVERGMGLVDLGSRAADRREYVARLDRRAAAEEAHRCGLPEPEMEQRAKVGGRNASRGLRRGWYWGSEAFRERMLEMAGPLIQVRPSLKRTTPARDHGERMCEEIVELALSHYGLEDEDALRRLTGRGDYRRVSVAWAIRRGTSVSQGWLAVRMNLRNGANASQQIGRFGRLPDSKLSKEIREWKKKVSKILS